MYNASITFQRKNRLQPQRKVGNKFIGVAMTLGLGIINDVSNDKSRQSWPPKLRFVPLVANEPRGALFGRFTFRYKPISGNPENVEILDN